MNVKNINSWRAPSDRLKTHDKSFNTHAHDYKRFFYTELPDKKNQINPINSINLKT